MKKTIEWIIYSVMFLLILYPLNGLNIKAISISLVIGFFAGILNTINNKL